MRRRDWYFTRLYPWRTRFAKHPFLTAWYALADRFWFVAVRLKRSPLLSMRTFWGQTLLAPFPDYRSLLHHGLLDARELPVEDFFVQNLTEHDVFFDVGANIGFYAALAQALGAKAYAFEPTPRTFAILKRNVPTAILINKALLDKEGEISFTDFGVENAGSNMVAKKGDGNIKVQTITLDAFCKENNIYPTYIKMDVEKAEAYVLAGAKEVLSKRPTLIIETGDQQVIAQLISLGYEAYHYNHAASGAATRYSLGEEPHSANLLFISPQI